MATTLHVVTTLTAGYAREDASSAGVVGAYFDAALARAVAQVAGPCAAVAAVEIGHIPPGYVQSMNALGITVGRSNARPEGSVPLATLQDILDVADDATFQKIVDELPATLHSMRARTRLDGHAGFTWPIHWRPSGGPSTITTHCTDGTVRQELPVTFQDQLENPAWRRENSARLEACLGAFEGVPTEKFAGKSAALFVGGEAYFAGMNPTVDGNGMELELSGDACQILAESFAGQFEGSGAINFLEVNLSHASVGPMSVTIQRVHGKTPGQLRSEALAELAKTKELLAQPPAAFQVRFDSFTHPSGGKVAGQDYVLPTAPALDQGFFEGCCSLIVSSLIPGNSFNRDEWFAQEATDAPSR